MKTLDPSARKKSITSSCLLALAVVGCQSQAIVKDNFQYNGTHCTCSFEKGNASPLSCEQKESACLTLTDGIELLTDGDSIQTIEGTFAILSVLIDGYDGSLEAYVYETKRPHALNKFFSNETQCKTLNKYEAPISYLYFKHEDMERMACFTVFLPALSSMLGTKDETLYNDICNAINSQLQTHHE